MSNPTEANVPDGAAVFPMIPPELGISPLLLAALHAVVFLEGSEEDVVDPEAAEEAMEYIATYLQRLDQAQLQRVREDVECLAGYARQQQWPRQQIRFLKGFLADFGIDERNES
jgi:hypothetical protein